MMWHFYCLFLSKKRALVTQANFQEENKYEYKFKY